MYILFFYIFEYLSSGFLSLLFINSFFLFISKPQFFCQFENSGTLQIIVNIL